MPAPNAVLTILVPLGALALAALVTRIAIGLGVMDRPNHRSAHAVPTPRGGGLGPVAALALGILVLQAFTSLDLLPDSATVAAVLGAFAMAALGLADDVRPLPASRRLAVQAAAALAAMAAGLVIDHVWVPFAGTVQFGVLAWPVTFVWIVGLTNATNFMDGLDGLAGGVAAVALILAAVTAALVGEPAIAMLALLAAGGTLGFLLFNFPQARIFMGDVGSQFLGFLLAALAVLLSRADSSGMAAIVVPLAMLAFVFDTAFTLFRRWRRGAKLVEAHREHLYQLLHRSGLDPRRIALMHHGFALMQGLAALTVMAAPAMIGPAALAAVLAVQVLYAVAVCRRARAAGL